MPVIVDITEVLAMTKAAVRSLNGVGVAMKKTLDKAAKEERRTHEYNNITHRLENSTFALGPFGSGDNVEVEYGARMDYASNVEDRGRSNVSKIGDQAAVELDYYFDSEAQRIGGM
jgi:hypothetical protein